MVAGEHKFHPECFCCQSCKAFIGDGDSYALVERSKLYWFVARARQIKNVNDNFSNFSNSGQCYRRQMQPLARSSHHAQNTPAARPPHSIRLVDIPWTKGNKGGIRLSVDESQIGAPISAGACCPGVRISE